MGAKLMKAGIKPDDDPNDSKTAQKLIEAGLQSSKEFRARLERERKAKKQRTLKRHAERRAKALKKQGLGHDLESRKETENQARERMQLREMKALKGERELLKMTLEKGIVPNDKIGNAIERVDETRHNQETQNLLAKQGTEKTEALRKGLKNLFGLKAEERLNLIKELDLSMASLDETKERMDQLNSKFAEKQKQLNEDLDAKFTKSHAEELMGLKKTQLKEIAAAYQELAPLEVQQEFGIHEQSRLGGILQDYEADVMGDDAARQAAEDQESKLRKKHEEEVKALEAANKAKLEKDRAEAEKRLEEHKIKLLADQERLKEERLKEAGNMDEQQRQLILEEMGRGKQRIEEALSRQKEAQIKHLQAQLDARHKRMMKKKEKELKKQVKQLKKRE